MVHLVENKPPQIVLMVVAHTLEAQADVEGHTGKGHELSVESDGAESTERSTAAKLARYRKSFLERK
jgi:hypothetical protein